MATTARGHIEQLPSGSFRVNVYAGTDPVTGKPRRLKQTCPDEASAAAALGKLLAQADGDHFPNREAVGTLPTPGRRPCRVLSGGSPDGRAATAGPAGPHPQVCGTRPLSSADGRACKTGPDPSSVPGMLLLSTIPVTGAPVGRVSDGASRHP